MSEPGCQSCPGLVVSRWGQGGTWRTSQPCSGDFQSPNHISSLLAALEKSQICVILARATNIRSCQRCRNAFIQALQMPERWWSDSFKKSNGYFGCETTRQAGVVTDTWVYFETKYTRSNVHYEWTKLNMFTRWIPSTQETILVLFDPTLPLWESILQSLSKTDTSQLAVPFWPYPYVLEVLADLEEPAVWAIRDQVRDIEKELIPSKAPRPEYRRLHDIARHAIHVTENLDVSVQNIETILKQYDFYIASQKSDSYSGADEDIRNQIDFFRGYVANLRFRSISNEKRLQNEIQLAFNTVAQANAGISVEIGRAAQIDNSNMKTIAFVTLAFLPPTFISSIFSMSFFQCGVDNGWGTSDKFWLYWVFAIPTTIGTILVYQYWHKLFPAVHHREPVVISMFGEHEQDFS